MGWNLRLTEFQAALLRAQLDRFEAQQKQRDDAANRLIELLAEVEGVEPDTEDERWTAHGRHLFMMRFPAFGGDAAVRDTAVEALHAEGLTGASAGYIPLHHNDAVIRDAKAIADKLGQDYPQPACPVTDAACRDTIWLPQPWLLGDDDQIAGIAEAITKVTRSADRLR